MRARLVRGTHKGYFWFAAMTLAVSIGVNLVVFTVVAALWLRPLPFPNADRVVTFPQRAWNRFDFPVFGSFLEVAGQVVGDDRTSIRPQLRFEAIGKDVETLIVTANYFKVLGLTVQGRDLTVDDESAGSEPVAVISRRLWEREFGGRREVIGEVLPARPVAVRVVGVAPEGFSGARRGEQTDVWITKAVADQMLPGQDVMSASMLALCLTPPGQSAAAIERKIRTDFATDRLVALYGVVPITDVFGAAAAQSVVVREGNALKVVGGLTLLVLLGGCATLAALTLVHSERRRSEVAVRIALGASRARLLAQRCSELGVVAAAGAIGALALAWWGLRAVPALSLPGGVDLSRLDLSFDWRVVVVALGSAAAVMFIAAAVPIWHSTSGVRLGDMFAGPAATASVASQRLRQALLSMQVAATIVVMIAAGLFVRAVANGFGSLPGFSADRTLIAQVQTMSPRKYPGPDWQELYAGKTRDLEAVIAQVPGVESVAEGRYPIGPDASILLARPVTVEADGKQRSLPLGRVEGSPRALETLGVQILAGRALTPADAAARPRPAVITASLARKLWGDKSPLGEILSTELRDGRFVVVGIASNFVYGSLGSPVTDVVVTAHSLSSPLVSVVVNVASPAITSSQVQRAIEAAMPEALWIRVSTGREVIAKDLGQQRLGAWFFSGFGLSALLLGIGGVFGLVAYLGESRYREFGVRLALGATPEGLMRLSLAVALRPVAFGVVIGCLVAALVSRVFSSLLTGLSAVDPFTYVLVAVVMVTSATAAALVAAWKLRKIAPTEALMLN